MGGFDGPGGIAISPKTGTVYVANDLSSTVSVISGKTNGVTTSIGFPDGNVGTEEVAVSPKTGNVYAEGVTNGGLVNDSAGALWVISGQTNTVTGHVFITDGVTISEGAISPRTGDVYSIGSANDVSVISG